MANSPRATQQKFEPWTDPDAKPYVRIEKVTKKFGDFVAVDDVTLDIYQKEIFCLLGRLRLRQDDAAAHAGWLRAADGGPYLHRRRGHDRLSRRTSGRST